MITDRQIRQLYDNSYKNFHAEGLDYLCLHRSLDYTLKAYFFGGESMERSSEVVNPHNHRYNFVTRCLRGAVWDHRYWRTNVAPSSGGDNKYNAYSWYTKLPPGCNGFFLRGDDAYLECVDSQYLRPGREGYTTSIRDIHTLQIIVPGSVLLIEQFKDIHTGPTQTFVQGDAPKLDGLYEKFTEAEIMNRLLELKCLLDGRLPCLLG